MQTFTLEDNNNSKKEPDFIHHLNPNQREAVTHVNGPILIVAGAGSGKTRVLTYRIAYLLHQKLAEPYQIMALTFTNKAAREMKARIKSLIGDQAGKLWMGTFHSTFAKILRIEAEHLGFDSNFSIYDTDDSERTIKQILKELNYDTKEIRPRLIQNKISSAKNEIINPDTYLEKFVHSTLDDITARVYKIYAKRLKFQNAMDFDDLLIKPIKLFKQNPDILEKYQDRFRFILIDEYQDTNHAQYTVTNLLASKYENLSVVGDDAQSIYSFRGADISNILNFKKDYPDSHEVPLEQNYRSTKSILRCADSVIKKNEGQLDKTLWTENNSGEIITLLDNYDERDEANRIANYIKNLKIQHGYDFNDFAVLYRTNYQSRVFEEAFRRKQIRYQLVGGLSFYQRKEVKDVLAYLTLLVNPSDEASLLRIINEPARGIGNKSINDLTSTARSQNKPVWEVLKHVEEADIYKPAENKAKGFVKMILDLRHKLEDGTPLSEITQQILKRSGYMKMLVEEHSHKSLSRRDNINELQNAISFYERNTKKPSLSSFLQEISLITDTDKYDENKSAVTLMTVHGSKGLEFPVVFISGLEENLFPMGSRQGEEPNIEEERRLFYVAITRAEERLYFSYCNNRYKFGEEKRMARSRFLDEVDAAVVRTEAGATITQDEDRYKADRDRSNADSFSNDWKKPLFTGKSSSQSETTIEYEGEDGDPFQAGVRVRHPKFGKGKILQRIGNDKNSKVVVFFKNRGQKKLMLRFAKLQLLA